MPQKQPPDSTATSLVLAGGVASSTSGGGITRAGSSARAQPARLPATAKRIAKRQVFLIGNTPSHALRHTRDEGERSGIDAIAQPGGCRAVVEDMTEMGVAAFARNLRSLHPEGVIRPFDDILLRNRTCKTWPACAGIEFVTGIEHRRLAADATKQSVLVQIPICAGERDFGARMAGDIECGRRKALLPFCFAEHDLRDE